MRNVAINGLGRIGRAALKILLDEEDLRVVAVNDIASIENLAYLLRHDSVYGHYRHDVLVRGDDLVIDAQRVRVLAKRDPADLPWHELGIDLVLECTGKFTDVDGLMKHVRAGASFVILSAPTKADSVPTVVHGVSRPDGSSQIVSCASCTTNCITPVLEVATRRLGAQRAIMTTVHAYTASQHLIDSPSKDFRRGRAGAVNLVPASTGAAIAATRALPEMTGRFDGVAVRAPIPVGSLADIVVVTDRPVTVDEVNATFDEEARTSRYAGILDVSRDALVSSDIVGDPHAAVVDLSMTRVVDGTLVKVMAWYDNEWGFTHQMVREARSLLGLQDAA
ncbi:type I glyceraldehyde-3-phosphate dehydrogenase [Humibacter sp.]|uniref:type I glyceraldehyde-3-phosphate dehydrogenase n=1 Tax=Humibacter sp. TaxID=1940291 RepID=UPI003F7D4CAC